MSQETAIRRKRKRTDENKAARCISIVIHLTPGITSGAHVPDAPAADMRVLLTNPAKGLEPACDESNFVSHAMHGGDLCLFFNDVAHYGPANTSTTDWRFVLFVLYSPEKRRIRRVQAFGKASERCVLSAVSDVSHKSVNQHIKCLIAAQIRCWCRPTSTNSVGRLVGAMSYKAVSMRLRYLVIHT